MNEEFNPIRYLKNFAIDIIVVVVAVAYVLYQTLSFEQTQLNPLILIAQAFIGIVCGVVIKQALGEKGFTKGYSSNTWEETERTYMEECRKALPNMDKVDNFYRSEEIARRKNYRREHLQSKMMRYEDWFDADGNYIGTKARFKELTLGKKIALLKCIRVKIYVLNMFSESGTATEEDTRKEMTDNRQRRRNVSKNTLSAVAIAIIGVYFAPILGEWNWANIIYSTMQVALWVLFGVLQLYSNYNFVVQDKVGVLRKKKELIIKFQTGCENGLYKDNPYDLLEVKYPINRTQA